MLIPAEMVWFTAAVAPVAQNLEILPQAPEQVIQGAAMVVFLHMWTGTAEQHTGPAAAAGFLKKHRIHMGTAVPVKKGALKFICKYKEG